MLNNPIGILDPSLESPNTGDRIIREGVDAALEEIGVPAEAVIRFPTQRSLNKRERSMAADCAKFVLGGTNLLSSNMPWYMQWRLRPADLRFLDHNVLLLGVGWWQYQGAPNWFTRRLLTRVLASDAPHSVRDSMTRRQLTHLDLDAINTSCPTMWGLPDRPEMAGSVSDSVVITFTNYNRVPELDARFLRAVQDVYPRVKLWPQHVDDRSYVNRLSSGVEVISEDLRAFEQALDDGADYFGTRLHAGIKALQRGRRSTIIAVDNRAAEIRRDTGLPVVSRSLEEPDRQFAFGSRDVVLSLPRDEIVTWRQACRSWLGETA